MKKNFINYVYLFIAIVMFFSFNTYVEAENENCLDKEYAGEKDVSLFTGESFTPKGGMTSCDCDCNKTLVDVSGTTIKAKQPGVARCFCEGSGNFKWRYKIKIISRVNTTQEGCYYCKNDRTYVYYSSGAKVRNDCQFHSNRNTEQCLKLNGTAEFDDTCAGILGPTMTELIQNLFDLIQVAGPILLIIMTIIDLMKAVASGKDELKKLGEKTVKRVIYAALLFVFPPILNWLLQIFGLFGTCGIN